MSNPDPATRGFADPGPEVEGRFHAPTNTLTYIVVDRDTSRAAVIDPVLDYDPASGRTATTAADALIARIKERALEVDWVLETHVHADHMSAGPYVAEQLGGRTGIGREVCSVQRTFGELFNVGAEFTADGSQFDHLFEDGERFAIGGLTASVLHTPGHTPACVTYVVGDAAFVGDTIFMPDFGTARVDFPGGDAATLYRSVRRILALPPATRLFVGHDYMPGGRELDFETTVALERDANKHVRDGVDESAFVAMRTERDQQLSMPSLIIPAVQVNIRGGRLPPREDNGVAYIKVPVNVL